MFSDGTPIFPNEAPQAGLSLANQMQYLEYVTVKCRLQEIGVINIRL